VATTRYSDLLTEVLPNLAADPSDPVTENAIKQTVIELCAEAWLWRYIPDPLDVDAGESYYDLEPPTGADVTAVFSAEVDGVALENVTIDWLNANQPRWRSERDTPKFFTQLDPEQIILAKVPASYVMGGLTMTLVLQPSQSATGFPSWIASQHLYTIATGAMSKLMLMPGKPWTNLQVGSLNGGIFSNAIAMARLKAANSLSRAPLRTTGYY
jgi:hypothetical protein